MCCYGAGCRSKNENKVRINQSLFQINNIREQIAIVSLHFIGKKRESVHWIGL